MARPMVIVGAGGYGREVVDVVDAMKQEGDDIELLGLIDDAVISDQLLERLQVPVVGGSDSFPSLPPGTGYAVCIANPWTRRALVDRAEAAGLEPVTLVHPSATVGRDVVLGSGTVICAGARLSTNIRVGPHCQINLNATVGHDSTLSEFVVINPLAAVSGKVFLGANVTVGTNSAILQGLNVGEDAVVGAGAVVVRDVEPRKTVVGVPARPMGG